jgi:hypothetical protein
VNFTLEVVPTPLFYMFNYFTLMFYKVKAFYCLKLKYLGSLYMLIIVRQFGLAAYRIKASSLWLAACL